MRDTCVDFNRPVNAHMALFFAPGSSFKPISIATSLPDEITELFGGNDPNIFSYPPEVPNDAPRLVFNSEVAELVASFTRVDFQVKVENYFHNEECLRDVFVDLVRILRDKHNLRFNRMGFLLRFPLKDEVDINLLRDRYIKDDKLSEARELQLSWMKRFEIQGLEVNRWVRVLYMDNAQGREQSLIIDTNTLAEKEYSIDNCVANSVIEKVQSEVRGDLSDVIEWD